MLVNGQEIPFHMKIGDAGEAFFVFETDGEVPQDLITSPILEAQKLDEDREHDAASRFGARHSPEQLMQNGSPSNRREEKLDVR